jgi:hypothetical protein
MITATVGSWRSLCWAGRIVRIACVLLAGACCFGDAARGEGEATASPRLILVHYMPWFEADANARRWGWHWTMNKYDPSVVNNDRREIASKYYPAIGPYDSGDPHVIEYHLLLMKIAGIDGTLVSSTATPACCSSRPGRMA